MILLISDSGWDVPRGTIGSGYIVLHRQEF